MDWHAGMTSGDRGQLRCARLRYREQLTGTFDISPRIPFIRHHITMARAAAWSPGRRARRLARSFRDWGGCYCAGGENNTCGKRYSQQFGTLPAGTITSTCTATSLQSQGTDMQAASLRQLAKLTLLLRSGSQLRAPDTCYSRSNTVSSCAGTPHADRPGSLPHHVRPDAGFSERSDPFLEGGKSKRAICSAAICSAPAFEHIAHRVVGDLRNSDLITTTRSLSVLPG